MSEIIIVIEDEDPIALIEVAEQGPPGPPGPPGDGEGSGAASGITFTPAGTIAATNVQAAIEELDNDSRMSNARTPSAHKSTHATGGSDALSPSDIGAQPAGSYVTSSDSRLTDSREWTAETVTQAEAETGTATTRRAWTAQRVRQAISAWWATVSSTKADAAHTHTFADVTPVLLGGVSPGGSSPAAVSGGVYHLVSSASGSSVIYLPTSAVQGDTLEFSVINSSSAIGPYNVLVCDGGSPFTTRATIAPGAYKVTASYNGSIWLVRPVAWATGSGTSALTAQSDGSIATADVTGLDTALSGKQATLISGTNIKPVAGQSLLGSANIPALLTDPTGITGADALTNIISLTQAEYDAIGSKSSTTLYIIT
jgi:hypothetical protein